MRALKRLFRWLFGRRQTQPFFERLQAAALAGMNIGTGTTLSESGERGLIIRLARYYPTNTALTLFDVGANRGDYAEALLMAFAQHVGASIFAFEPSPETYRRLQERLGRTPGVTLEAIGFGAAEETRTLFHPASDRVSGNASLYPRRLDHFNTRLDAGEAVRIRTLDAYCAERNVVRIHVLKLDIEGHELSALQGAHRMLQEGRIDFIQFEFGGCNIDARTFFQDFYYLLTGRYDLYRLLPRGLAPIESYRERYEAFITTNFLAARRDLHANFLRD